MCFIIREKGDLTKWMAKANEEEIIMTCSTRDEGAKIENAYPIGFGSKDKTLIGIAACDEYGRPIREAGLDDCDYLIQGQKMAAGAVPFLKSKETIDGSSVATTLAAGLCSLTLTCDRLQNGDVKYDKETKPNSRYKLIEKQLNSMTSASNKKFILLNRLGGIDSANGTPSADYILKSCSRTQAPF
jgi:hypothetical protein